jgi:hypothetical protein
MQDIGHVRFLLLMAFVVGHEIDLGLEIAPLGVTSVSGFRWTR